MILAVAVWHLEVLESDAHLIHSEMVALTAFILDLHLEQLAYLSLMTTSTSPVKMSRVLLSSSSSISTSPISTVVSKTVRSCGERFVAIVFLDFERSDFKICLPVKNQFGLPIVQALQ